MSKVIHKWVLLNISKQKINIPVNAKIISVHEQVGVLCLWFICNPDEDPAPRIIYIFMTGIELPEKFDGLLFIGTVLNLDGYVLHVFEEPTPLTDKEREDLKKNFIKQHRAGLVNDDLA